MRGQSRHSKPEPRPIFPGMSHTTQLPATPELLPPEGADSMRFPVARYPGFVAVCSVMLVTLTVGCETEPEPALSVNGTWMGSEQVLDSNSPVRALRWELALVDVPPDSIWGRFGSRAPTRIPGGPSQNR